MRATDELTQFYQDFLPTVPDDGIEYNDAGRISVVHYGNGLQEHIQPNAAFLPNQIWVDHGTPGTTIWDTGQYLYDGAQNIKQIGADYYRYDAALRLSWERINSSQQGVVDLDQSYDVFGNMTAQTATRTGSYTDGIPLGLAFSGRTYTVSNQNLNRISNTNFAYDPDGNLVSEPAHDGMTAQSYSFTPENQLARVTPWTTDSHPGTPWQTAMYEGGDHRWFRTAWTDRSKALITLRDASGQVVADYMESNASSGIQLQREYVHANGQLVAINSTCGPRPLLALSNPATVGTSVAFDKTDYVTPTGTYTMFIRTDDGQSKSISGLSISNHFTLPQGNFYPNVTNYISLEADAECGHTGYSNAVSYAYNPSSTGCIKSSGAHRASFTSTGSSLTAQAIADCPSQTTYNVYYRDPNAEEQSLGPLNGSHPTSTPSKQLANIPCGSGEGYYWVTPVSPTTHLELDPSPTVWVDSTSCGDGVPGADGILSSHPGQPGMNVQYVHWDHLGSTRIVTDEHGVAIAAFKYYPFGLEAESFNDDDVRQRFTGHERDDRVGLDYMMARSCRFGLARFLEPDEYGGSARPAMPQSWNRYAYVMNDPVNANDPSGYQAIGNKSVHTTSADAANNGPVQNAGGQPDNSPGTTHLSVQLLHKIIIIRFDSRLTPSERIATQAAILNGINVINGHSGTLSSYEKGVFGNLNSIGVSKGGGEGANDERPSVDLTTGNFTHTVFELVGPRPEWTASVIGHDAFHVYLFHVDPKSAADIYLSEFLAGAFQLNIGAKFGLLKPETETILRSLLPVNIDKRYAQPLAPEP